jgi:hypothetical protein
MLRLEQFCPEQATLCATSEGRHTAALLEAIKEAIGNYAECETGHREYFCGRPHSAGCKHT